MRMLFELVGEISDIEVLAIGTAIREVGRLKKKYGDARWRKLKGIATLQLSNGMIVRAEVHWYEAHGIGRKEIKIKRFLRTL